MVKYTLTLNDTKALFTPEQNLEYFSYFAFTGNNTLDTAIKEAFDARYANREISNGTPRGFLDDMKTVYLAYKDVISAMFSEYELDGYFKATYLDSDYSETRTPDLSHTRTPNVKTENNGKQVYSDTPDSSGVISGGYASAVTTNSNTVQSTGTETTTETGTEKRQYTLQKGIPHGNVWEMVLERKRSIIDMVLSYYAPCFIMLY